MDREPSASSSSDEEEDQQTLIHQRDTRKQLPLPTHHHDLSTFHIDDLRTRIASRFSISALNNNRRHLLLLLAICLPLLLLVLFFTTDLRSFFPANPACVFSLRRTDPLTLRIRDSQLKALYLLNQQGLGLLSLWNRTLPSHSNSTSNSSGDLKASLFNQISLNREIQQLLLSSHRTANSSPDSPSSDASTLGLLGCQKVDYNFSGRRTMEWNPKSNKFLFAICVSGQMSNHLICLEKHMFFAALLGRVLVIPSSRVDYEFSRVLDIDHINQCFGKKAVVTFEEFSEMRNRHLHINRVICYFSSPVPCYVDEEHVKKLKSLGISMSKLEAAWDEDIKKPSKRNVRDVEAKFSSKEDVIAIGDVFYADVEQEWVMQPGGPLAHKCRTLIEPSRLIMLTAQRFIQTFLGKDFIALHFRRHGFLKFCNAKEPSCFFPIPQAAECINRVVERASAPVIYLSTDAAESETSLLQSLVFTNGNVVPLVKRPARNSAEKWDALLYRHGLEQDSQVEVMLDKTICAMSQVFIGASGSTFTEDILRLRKDWGSASLCDEYLCRGETPNFIAGDE